MVIELSGSKAEGPGLILEQFRPLKSGERIKLLREQKHENGQGRKSVYCQNTLSNEEAVF